MSEANTERIVLRVSPRLKDAIEKSASVHFQNASEYIRQAAVERMKKDVQELDQSTDLKQTDSPRKKSITILDSENYHRVIHANFITRQRDREGNTGSGGNAKGPVSICANNNDNIIGK